MARWFLVFALVGGTRAVSDASPQTQLEGTVMATSSRWSADGSIIVTTLAVVDEGGNISEVQALGGRVDGLSMFFSHAPPIPTVGDEVRITTVESNVGGRKAFALESVTSTALAAAATGDAAAAYGVHRTRQSDTPLWREESCLHFEYAAAGTTHLAGDLEHEILDRAFAAWTREAQDCSGLSIVSSVVPDLVAGPDDRNSVHFRESSWCRPATNAEPQFCFDPSAAAVTRLLFVDDPSREDDGRIIEADLDFNAAYFAFNVDGATEALPTHGSGSGAVLRTPVDLLSVATHEAGHALGLAHNCYTGSGRHPRDEKGRAVAMCADVADDPRITEATMYFNLEPGESHKQSLEPTDVAALCVVASGSSCDLVGTTGCAVSYETSETVGVILVILVLGLRRRDATQSSRGTDR